jgi:F0F1-type ATP synthase delta subunit
VGLGPRVIDCAVVSCGGDEESLDRRETDLARREADLARWEKDLAFKEEMLERRKNLLAEHELEAEEKERTLEERVRRFQAAPGPQAVEATKKALEDLQEEHRAGVQRIGLTSLL